MLLGLVECRAYTNQVNEEINTTSANALKYFISLGKEMMTACGKQGASLKLKRGIAVKSPGCLSSSPIETSLPPRG